MHPLRSRKGGRLAASFSCLVLTLVLAGTALGQTRRPITVPVHVWPYPDAKKAYMMYEALWQQGTLWADSVVPIYLRQSVDWRRDTTMCWTRISFDSVIGRGDQRKALIKLVQNVATDSLKGWDFIGDTVRGWVKWRPRADTLSGHATWLVYTRPLSMDQIGFVKGDWGGWWTNISQITDSTQQEFVLSLEKVTGLDALSRARLRIFCRVAPVMAKRWWQSP